MLSLAAINSIEYYSNLAREDYYVSGGEPPGRWAGTGAHVMGLTGEIADEDLHSIMNGFNISGQALCENAGRDSRRHGWDLCFSPPKSVSLIWARADEALRTHLQDAQLAAVQAAIRHAERHAATTRRDHDGSRREKVVGLVAATFEHSTSRALDPQLHTHVLIMNLAPRFDTTWGSIESRDLFLWQRSIGAVYQAALAERLRCLGFTPCVDEDGRSFEIAGVSAELCRHFSKRAAQIEYELQKRGARSSASAIGNVIKLSSRDHKTDVDRSDLHARWSKEFDQFGFSLDTLAGLRRSNRLLDIDDDGTSAGYPLEPQMLLDRLTETNAVFQEREAFQIAAELALLNGETTATAEHVAEAAISSSEAVDLGVSSRYCRLFTTHAQLQAERQLVSAVKHLRAGSGFEVPGSKIEDILDKYHLKLSDEQIEAVVSACQEHRFAILQGSAGAGKSSSMACVRAAYSCSEFAVIGAAVAKSAADNLAKEAGMPTSTIAKLLIDIERGRTRLTDRTVVIVDEASQVSTPQLSVLANFMRSSGAKLILVGEDRQLDAVEHGGMLRYLSRPEILGASRVQTIRRQKDEWARNAVADFRDGRARNALQAYFDRGFLYFCQDRENVLSTLLERWKDHRLENSSNSILVVAQRWRDVHELSNRIRSFYLQEGVVAPNGVMLNCVVGEHLLRLEFAVGDRVRFTRNDYKLGFTNGSIGELVNVEEAHGDYLFGVRLEDGAIRSFKLSEYCDPDGRIFWVHAYATTIYASQGLTVDDTLVLHDAQMDRAAAYVAGSRHRNSCHWFCNNSLFSEPKSEIGNDERLALLGKQLSQDRYRSTALELYEQLAGSSEYKLERSDLLEI